MVLLELPEVGAGIAGMAVRSGGAARSSSLSYDAASSAPAMALRVVARCRGAPSVAGGVRFRGGNAVTPYEE
eukprot:2983276-Prymnesium_polylepis.1